jgi:hypothetical protein
MGAKGEVCLHGWQDASLTSESHETRMSRCQPYDAGLMMGNSPPQDTQKSAFNCRG